MTKTLFTVASIAVVAGIASGCSSATSASTLEPAQIDANGPTPVPRPDGPTGVKQPPPIQEPTAPAAECPATRGFADATLASPSDVRALLVGIYEKCSAGENNVELRIDPDKDTSLLWYLLDDRFVRLGTATGTAGWMEIEDCDGAACNVTWWTPGGGDFGRARTLRVWTGPTAFTIESQEDFGAWSSWLRVAD